LEKGEVGILAVQFGALIFAVLLLSNFAYGTNASSTPAITTVYWGSPPPASGISIGTGTNIEKTNASAVSFFYTLAYSTHLVAAAASRFCINPETNATVGGGETVYTNIPNLYSTAKKAYYFTFSLTGQPTGWNCVYSITITDSLQQMANWAGTVIVKPPPGGLN
jgi:hypothetical protein